MNRAQRTIYHAQLWPAVCQAHGWDPRDRAQRVASIVYCMEACGCPGPTSSSALDQAQITALFTLLARLADPGALDALLAWERCQEDYRAFNQLRQARWWEQKAGYRPGHGRMRHRFPDLPDPDNLGHLDAPGTTKVARQYLLTARSRAKAKHRELDTNPF